MPADKWFQQVLLAEEVIEVRIRIGFIPSRDHAQWMVEVVDPTTERLMDAMSRPHMSLQRWEVEGPAMWKIFRSLVDDLVEPF